jgi:FtsH-binding integral membrane protein
MNNFISYKNIFKSVAVLLLFYATSRHQYSFYIFLRWYIFIVCIYFAFSANKENIKVWLIIFSTISLLFNPIIPVYLNKELWSVIDIVSGILIFISMFYFSKKKE